MFDGGGLKLLLVVCRVNGEDVSFEVTFVAGHVVAQVAGETPALVHGPDVHSEVALLSGNIAAFITDISSAQMHLLLVKLKSILCFCPV